MQFLFKSQEPKLDNSLNRKLSNDGAPDILSATPPQRLSFSNTFNFKSVLQEGSNGAWHQAYLSRTRQSRAVHGWQSGTVLLVHSHTNCCEIQNYIYICFSIFVVLNDPSCLARRKKNELLQYKGKNFKFGQNLLPINSLPPKKSYFLNYRLHLVPNIGWIQCVAHIALIIVQVCTVQCSSCYSWKRIIVKSDQEARFRYLIGL